MKNITVSVDDEVYQRARVKAAEMSTSVSALVRSYLIQVTSEETDWERRKRLERETIAAITAFRAGDRLDRAEAHERDAFS
ncbi:MAG: hypothetical protein M9936_18660 [Caldilinea sp.]|nr:hypothetical protein [Caldilinea sp.]MCB0068211.1 hypothetical protein [Caldilineaceae bacterium]MCB0050443.1 hypothetical protein [Caldilinea sp.]MCB0136596.1 hypothetical protein [Caldilineaceae bacterium]MCB0148285.1 hypothetical protein [Caldilineaceae bacterium]